MMYFGTRLSENISRREPEGYLICLNVPVARTGMQEYLPEELGLDPGGAPVQVWRPSEEVFDPACAASFEGMPVTDDHPAFVDGVNAENIRYLQKGHAHNIRRGTGREADLLLADLIITDPGLIEAILNGKREISCGYNYSLCEEDGRYIQRKIRGNHIAVVDAGRAGPRVSIRDHAKAGRHQKVNAGKDCENERSFRRMKQIRKTVVNRPDRSHAFAKRTARLMARMARDGETEELAEMIAEMMEPEAGIAPERTADPAEEVAEAVEEILEAENGAAAPMAAAEPANQVNMAGCGEQIVVLLQQILALLRPAADCGNSCEAGRSRDEDPGEKDVSEAAAVETLVKAAAGAVIGHDPATDPVESMVKEAIEAASEEESAEIEVLVGEVLESVVAGPDDGEENPLSGLVEPEEKEAQDRTEDALRKAMSAFRPVLKALDPSSRSEVVGRIAAGLRGRDLNRPASGNRTTMDAYAALRTAARRPDPSADTDLGKRIMARRNANLRVNL